MENAKQQVIERLKQATNVLVTVSSNPSVDQLAACIGLTLVLNKNGKHATAVFSGQIPSTIEFLQPEKTLEKNTDSLRDFIIALDKSKADKLRYKVEDKVVKIFITPYQTSLSEKDLEFSQGDFNVDAVVALGVHEQADLDQAITSHGRILHDATVISINRDPNGNLGNINWEDSKASSLSELVAVLSSELAANIFDAQNATALLTGIVSETNRFSNDRTSAQTMNISAKLMTAGANQQLVATKLETLAVVEETGQNAPTNNPQPLPSQPPPNTSSDGTLEISHDQQAAEQATQQAAEQATQQAAEQAAQQEGQLHIDDDGNIHQLNPADNPAPNQPSPPGPSVGLPVGLNTPAEEPVFDGVLTANSQPQPLEPSTDPFTPTPPVPNPPILTRQQLPPLPLPTPLQPVQQPSPPIVPNQADSSTLEDIEKAVRSPHLVAPVDENQPNLPHSPDVESARNAVLDAVNSAPSSQALEPIAALNAQPVFDFHDPANQTPPPPPSPSPLPTDTPDDGFTPMNMPLPQNPPVIHPTFDSMPFSTDIPSDNPPPPVPPPMMPPIL
jgi:hypothetical protein